MSEEQIFVAEYTSALKALVRNDKAQINMLSMLAEDNKKYVNGIVGAIEQHILTCPPPVKLPALYLVDSIIKNVKEPYKTAFSARLDEVFGSVWDTTLQDKRISLTKLVGLWAGWLPPHVLDRVKRRMVSTSNAGQHAVAVPQQPAPLVMPVQQPVPMQQQPVPMQQQQQQPTIIVQQPGIVPGQYSMAGPQFQVVQQQPAPVYAVPPNFMGMPQQPPTLVNINGTLVPIMQQQPMQQPIIFAQQPLAAVSHHGSQHATPHHSSQHATPQHVMQAGPPLGLPSPGHGSWQQQQQQMVSGPGPMVRRSPGSPAAAVAQPEAVRNPPPPPRGRQNARKSASPLPSSAALTSDALNKLLSNLTSGTLSGRQHEVEAVQKVTDFDPAFIKEKHDGVLQLLEDLSKHSRDKFKDIEFQRRKRRAAASGAPVSRTWYLTVDTWIAGTLATDQAAAHNPFEENESGLASEEAEEALEPEDPDQPCCAISGEPFDKLFNQDSEEWFYKGAKRIHGEEAAAYGVPDGSLVKVKCLAEAELGSGAAAMMAAGAAAEQGGEVEAGMAAAAADAPAAGQAAATAAEEVAAEQQQQQRLESEPPGSTAVVKQEQIDDIKPEALLAAKQEAAAQQQQQPVGSKREATSSPEAAEGEPGPAASPAKRAKLEQTA